MASTPSPKRSPKGSTSPSSLIHKRRDSQLLAIDQIQQGFPVWVQNPYEEGSNSHYRANQLPAAVCTRPTWVPAIVQSVDAKSGIISVKTTYVPPMILKLGRAEIWARNNTKTTLDDMVYFTMKNFCSWRRFAVNFLHVVSNVAALSRESSNIFTLAV